MTTPAQDNPTAINLTGQAGLVLGTANGQSIADGRPRAMRALGSESAIAHRGTKLLVRPLAGRFGSPQNSSCEVQEPRQLEAVFGAARQQLRRPDFALHGRLADCPLTALVRAMNACCHSFIHMAKLAEPSMSAEGTLLTTRYCGALKAIDHVEELAEQVAQRSPQHHLVSIDDMCSVAADLVSDCSPTRPATACLLMVAVTRRADRPVVGMNTITPLHRINRHTWILFVSCAQALRLLVACTAFRSDF